MGIYTSSNGDQKETADMPYPYLQNALRKAQDSGDVDNVTVLEAEINLRDNAESSDFNIDTEVDIDDSPDNSAENEENSL